MGKAPAKTEPSKNQGHIVRIEEEDLEINLKDRWLAAFLAWLIPGLGHLYQGRTAKGVLFMVCVLGTFFYGLFAISGGKVVYASIPGDTPYRWQYWCQVGAGLPALPALVQRSRAKSGKPVLWENANPPYDRLMAPPRRALMTIDDESGQEDLEPFTSEDKQGHIVTHPSEFAKWNHDLHDYFELGTVYTMIAGLLNILVIYDAASGPLILLPDKEATSKKGKEKDQAKSKDERGGDRGESV